MVVDEDDAALHDVLRGSRSSTSVPSPGAGDDRRACRRRARAGLRSTRRARAGRPGRRRDRSRSRGRGRRPTTASSVHLGVDVDLLDPGELRGVRHRLARGEHERRRRPGSRRRWPARRDAVQLLDVGRDRARARRRARRTRRRAVVAVEPAAQLALLPPRERRDAPRLLRVPLDQRERLQHRVVHARRDLGALVAADRAPRARRRARARAARATGPPIEQQRARDRTRREHASSSAPPPSSSRTAPTPATSEAAVRERRTRPEAPAAAARRARSPPRRARSRPPRGSRGRRRGGAASRRRARAAPPTTRVPVEPYAQSAR